MADIWTSSIQKGFVYTFGKHYPYDDTYTIKWEHNRSISILVVYYLRDHLITKDHEEKFFKALEAHLLEEPEYDEEDEYDEEE